MTVSPTLQTGAPLGVGSIVGESFTILMRHILSVLLLAVVPTLLGFLVSAALLGWGASLGIDKKPLVEPADFVPTVLSIIFQVVANGLTTALIVQLAYDAKLQRPLKLGRYVGPAVRAAVPIAILGVVSTLIMGIGLAALVVPGLWAYAVFSMMPAAVVIEKVGFGGLGRSASLTKEYRWPILGTFVVIFIVIVGINLVSNLLIRLLVGGLAGGAAGMVIGGLALTMTTALGYGLSSVAVALIYARLREIKEGTSVRDIAAVFD